MADTLGGARVRASVVWPSECDTILIVNAFNEVARLVKVLEVCEYAGAIAS
jgi:hypothetical protein